jgi:hypothetical protein
MRENDLEKWDRLPAGQGINQAKPLLKRAITGQARCLSHYFI